MIIDVITSRENDTEVYVSCPNCGANDYFDPRPWRHCPGCARIRVSGFIVQCTNCGDRTAPTGDGVNYVPGCFSPTEKAFMEANASADECDLRIAFK